MPKARRRDTLAMRRKYSQARRAEVQFAKALSLIAKRCGILARKIFKSNAPLNSSMRLRAALEAYGQALTPWARATAKRMVLDVARRDEKVWIDRSAEMSRQLRNEIKNAPTGRVLRQRSSEAAALITSLPLEAAQRVENFAIQYLTQGKRASVLATQILATGDVTKSRAMLIARTETSRTASILQQVRAESVGSEGYIWRTSNDIDVRDRHQRLEGKFFKWISPPVAGESGERAAPGEIYNCFTPETLIAPVDGHVSVFRSKYSGPVIILVLGETTLRVTPNHPILTTFGWKRAEDIKEGDDLINVPFESSDGVKYNVDDGLLPFSEIFKSDSLTRKTTPFLVDGFYGDIVNEHVDIVVPKSYLPPDFKPGVLQYLSKEVIPSPDSRIFRLAVSGCLPEVIEASFTGFSNDSSSFLDRSALKSKYIGFAEGSAGDSGFLNYATYSTSGDPILSINSRDACEVVGNDLLFRQVGQFISSSNISDSFEVLFRREFLKSELHRFTYGSDFNPSFFKNSSDRCSRASVFLSQARDTEAGKIISDNLLSREIRAELASGRLSCIRVTSRFVDFYSGHVFTSETTTGYYRVSPIGILSKNCRCWAEVVLPGERKPRVGRRFTASEVTSL
jgi:SPP1 gp7 family putative phage head morphogenesis protein